MIAFLKRNVAPLCILTLLALTTLGCRTAHGFGQDMENAGESIQEGTN